MSLNNKFIDINKFEMSTFKKCIIMSTMTTMTISFYIRQIRCPQTMIM